MKKHSNLLKTVCSAAFGLALLLYPLRADAASEGDVYAALRSIGVPEEYVGQAAGLLARGTSDGAGVYRSDGTYYSYSDMIGYIYANQQTILEYCGLFDAPAAADTTTVIAAETTTTVPAETTTAGTADTAATTNTADTAETTTTVLTDESDETSASASSTTVTTSTAKAVSATTQPLTTTNAATVTEQKPAVTEATAETNSGTLLPAAISMIALSAVGFVGMAFWIKQR